MRFDDTSMVWSQEPEEENDLEIHVHTLVKNYTLPATADNTFETQNMRTGGMNDGDARKYNAIFAINLDKFDSHSADFNTATSGIETDNELIVDATEVAATTLTPSTSGDVWVIGQTVQNNGNDRTHMQSRLQINGTDFPEGWGADSFELNPGWDNDDRLPWQTQFVNYTAKGTLINVDVDVSKENGDGAETAANSLALAVSLFQAPQQGAQGSAIITSVQHGSAEFTGLTFDAAIDPVDLEKSFLVFSYTVDDDRPDGFLVRGALNDTDNIHFERAAAAGLQMRVELHVLQGCVHILHHHQM